MAVASGVAYVTGLNPVAMNLGAVFPDLIEYLYPKILTHRGLSHSVSIHGVILILVWNIPYVRDVWIGVLIGHLFCDALTPSGVPLSTEKGIRAVLFGGKLRTGSMPELIFVVVFSIFCFALVGPKFRPGSGRIVTRDWGILYDERVIDQKEYRENRFNFL